MAHKQIVPLHLTTPALSLNIELVVYNYVLLMNSCLCCKGSCSSLYLLNHVYVAGEPVHPMKVTITVGNNPLIGVGTVL